MKNAFEDIQNIFQSPEKYLHSIFSNDGFSLPKYDNLKLFTVTPNEASQLNEVWKNLTVNCSQAEDCNYVLIDVNNKFSRSLKISFSGSNNIVIIGRQTTCRGKIVCAGNNGVIIVAGQNEKNCKVDIRLLDNNSIFFFGKQSTANQITCIINGLRKNVIIGDDCMFARDVWLRNSDMHSIFDIDTGNWLNPAGNIIIEPHVWVGQDSLILKNTEIGFGSIIGAKSLVNKKIPRCCIAAGIPAKVIKTNVSWDRPTEPRCSTIEHVRNFNK